jgi:hypothetical protein
MSQSPPAPSSPTSPSSPKQLDNKFAMNLNPEPPHGVMHIPVDTKQKMVRTGQLYVDSRLPKGHDVIDGRGGRRRISKKRSFRRRRSSKRQSRKARKYRTTRRK